MFQVCADAFGAGSELEGGQSQMMVNCLHAYLKNFNKSNKNERYPERLIEQLSSVVNLKNKDNGYFAKKQTGEFVKAAQDKIKQSLGEKKPVLIMGGWTGVPSGHAIYYEIIPAQKKGEVNFRLYNTGAGINHHLSIRNGEAIKYLPYCEWQGIKEESVQSYPFLNAIYEMTTFAETSGGTRSNYDADDVYVGL
jgi:hypothetical protein